MAAIEAIDSVYVQTQVSSITFSSIPQTYQHLQLITSMKDTETGNWGTADLNFNGATSGYTHNFLYWYRDYESGASDQPNPEARLYGMATSDKNPWVPMQVYGAAVMDIMDYTSTAKNTTWKYHACAGVSINITTLSTYPSFGAIGGGVYDSTAALTSILIRGDAGQLERGFEATLYGLNSS